MSAIPLGVSLDMGIRRLYMAIAARNAVCSWSQISCSDHLPIRIGDKRERAGSPFARDGKELGAQLGKQLPRERPRETAEA
jgi:hypothetical protein